MKKMGVIISVFVIISFLVNCDVGNGTEAQENPIPTLTSISPSSGSSHWASFTLTATGTDFVPNAKIIFDNIEKPTTYIDSTELSCWIGSPEHEFLCDKVLVRVRNPPPGGGDSNSLDFKVNTQFTFDEPKNITNSGDAGGPAITVDSVGNIYVGFRDYGSAYVKRSTDNGATWSRAWLFKVAEMSHDSAPEFAVDTAGNIYVVWVFNSSRIGFSCSTDNGKTWSQPIKFSDGVSPAITVDLAGNIYVVWEDSDVYFSCSTDKGATWSYDVNISNSSGDIRTPAIAVDTEGNINVVWDDWSPQSIFFSRSKDGGATWSKAVNISENILEWNRDPGIDADTMGNIYVVWNGDGLYFSRLKAHHKNWSLPAKIFDDGWMPAITVDNAGNIYVVWSGHSIELSCSTDCGATWREAADIFRGADSYLCRSAITVDSAGKIYVVGTVWVDFMSLKTDIFFTSGKIAQSATVISKK